MDYSLLTKKELSINVGIPKLQKVDIKLLIMFQQKINGIQVLIN